MSEYSISFKVKDYNPKLKSISFKDYLCILINGDFQIRIPLTNNNYSNSKHEFKGTKSDEYYKISLFDNKNKVLISISDFIIPYDIFHKINQNNSFIYEKEIKFNIGMKTKPKLYGSFLSNKIGDISIVISAKIFKKSKKSLSKHKSEVFKNYLMSRTTDRNSYSQRNLLQKKMGLKNFISKYKYNNKNKDDFFYSDSNRHISTNDMSGNHFNTFSMNEDTENNTNININNNSSIGNLFSHNYYYFNTTSRKDKSKSQKNVIENNLSEYTIRKENIDTDNSEMSKLLEKRNVIKKNIKFNYNNNLSNRFGTHGKTKNMKKTIINSKTLIRNSINKNKTRNSFNSYKTNKNENHLISEDEGGKSVRFTKKKIIELTNVDNNFNSCDMNPNKNYLSTDSKKIKNKIISKPFIHKSKIDKNKIISLSKGKYDKLNSKKKLISDNILGKVLLSDRLRMSHNLFDRSSGYVKRQKKIFKNIKKNIKINDNNADSNPNIKNSSKNENILGYKNSVNNISSPLINKTEYISFNQSKDNNSKDDKSRNKNESICNNKIFRIKVNKKLKNNSVLNDAIDNLEYNQSDLKNYIIKLSEYFILNNKNIKSIYLKYKDKIKRLNLTKELFFSLLKKSNALEEKKSNSIINNFQLYNVNNNIIEKINLPLTQIKKKEFKIYQRILNYSYCDNDIKEYKKNEKLFYEKIFNIQLEMIKTMIEHFGNISQIYSDDLEKKEKFKNFLTRYNIFETENKNHIIDLVSLNKINSSVKKIIKNTFNNDVYYQFNIIKEVQEEKESEKNSNYINDSQSQNISRSNQMSNSLLDLNDEILFLDKKESDYKEDLNNRNKKSHSRNNVNNESGLKNNRSKSSNSNEENNSKSFEQNIKEEDSYKKKNIRKELIGMHKRKFKGKILNFDEIGINCNSNKNSRKNNYFKISFFNKYNRKKNK